jgi:hypothetical protein
MTVDKSDRASVEEQAEREEEPSPGGSAGSLRRACAERDSGRLVPQTMKHCLFYTSDCGKPIFTWLHSPGRRHKRRRRGPALCRSIPPSSWLLGIDDHFRIDVRRRDCRLRIRNGFRRLLNTGIDGARRRSRRNVRRRRFAGTAFGRWTRRRLHIRREGVASTKSKHCRQNQAQHVSSTSYRPCMMSLPTE